jgi:hypothetical protein
MNSHKRKENVSWVMILCKTQRGQFLDSNLKNQTLNGWSKSPDTMYILKYHEILKFHYFEVFLLFFGSNKIILFAIPIGLQQQQFILD